MKYAYAAAFAAVAVALPADADWEPVKTTTPAWTEVAKSTTGWEEAPKPTSTWEEVKSTSTKWDEVEKKTCTTIYVTKDCGAGSDWNGCKEVTKTETLYDDKCTWAGWDKPATTSWEEVKPKETSWAEVSSKVCTYVTIYDNVYTTKECGSDSSAWDNCKDVTKTEKKTETKTDDKCTGTWGDWNTWSVKETTTWAEVSAKSTSTWAEASVAASSTWAAASISKPAASSTVWSPVAKFTGAADKQAIGFGAAAIAAVAMML